ncbi:hypothetical protein PHJA_002270500 [Phtheirospermum japonicum]|uniref:PPPDE domain-containing protein n=1 Tax=Phtheirospermum japonicum TaxID=374723 RepID=A0A830D204_9LAMI|nr:hypothetical protein PHJA_002270500 [Phtheirospermum japonicum]
MQINKIFKDGIGLGGIFHSIVQAYLDEEWSVGFCEQCTRVFSCLVTTNPMYTYREIIKIRKTSFSIYKVNQILRELSQECPGIRTICSRKIAIIYVMSSVKDLACQSFLVIYNIFFPMHKFVY